MGYLSGVTLLWAFSFSLIGVYLAGQVDSYFSVLMRIVLAGLVFFTFLTSSPSATRVCRQIDVSRRVSAWHHVLFLLSVLLILIGARSLAVYRFYPALCHLNLRCVKTAVQRLVSAHRRSCRTRCGRDPLCHRQP